MENKSGSSPAAGNIDGLEPGAEVAHVSYRNCKDDIKNTTVSYYIFRYGIRLYFRLIVNKNRPAGGKFRETHA